jgi:Acetoacetate decarboxylase (ADC)
VAERPNYIYQGGSVMMHSPLNLTNSEMYGFFVKGDLQKLQASIDATLNQAAAGRMTFKVLSPFVMLTFTRVNKANSANPIDHAKGWGEETDIVTWIMVGHVEQQNGKQVLKEIYSYPFHIWVNDCMALINGRELYGYPK